MDNNIKDKNEVMTYENQLSHFFNFVQRLIQEYNLTAEYAKELNPYVRDKFLELLM